MAPVKPRRRTMRSRSAQDPRGKYAPPSPSAAAQPEAEAEEEDTNDSAMPDFSSAFDIKPTKKDKRTIKHASLLHKVREASNSSAKIKKRRRPGKKLHTNLDALADALPDAEQMEQLNEEGVAKMKMKSMRTRPGATKRKRALEERERERFGRNLAELVGSAAKPEQQDGGAGQRDRWAALRKFIGGTMEKDAAFAGT